VICLRRFSPAASLMLGEGGTTGHLPRNRTWISHDAIATLMALTLSVKLQKCRTRSGMGYLQQKAIFHKHLSSETNNIHEIQTHKLGRLNDNSTAT
jgi:hypothetical protein